MLCLSPKMIKMNKGDLVVIIQTQSDVSSSEALGLFLHSSEIRPFTVDHGKDAV